MDELIPTETAHLTADEILYVLAGRKTVQLRDVLLVVVTGTHQPGPDEPQDWPFTPGEILVCQDRTELVGARSLNPWDTSALYRTTNLHAAVALSRLVTAGATRGMYEWDWHQELWYRSRNQPAAHRQWCSILDEFGAFIGNTDHVNTYGRDIAYPASFTWPTPPEETKTP